MKKKNHLNIMKRSPLFKGLSENELNLIYDELIPVMKTHSREEVIYHEGDYISRVGLIQKGVIRSEKVYEEGGIHIVSIHDAGETLCIEEAASASQISPVSYVANEEVVMVNFEIARLMKCRYSDRIMQNIIHALANDSIKRLYKIEMLSIRGLRSRIMAYLHRMEDKTGCKTFGINMDRERFAQYLCVNRSALSNELSQMKKDGLIDYKKGTFTLLDNR